MNFIVGFVLCISLLAVHVLLTCLVFMIFDEIVDEYNPIWKLPIALFWPTAIAIGACYKIKDWIQEVNDYYADRRR